MGINTALHFGIRIKGTENNLSLYDDSGTTTRNLTIPAGIYYYKHADPSKDLVYVVNQVIASYGSFSRSNDRQITLSLTDTNDYITLPDTDDRRAIAEALGLYSNAGLFTETWEDGDVSQIAAASFYTESGYLYAPRSFHGFPNWSPEHYQAEGGAVAAITGKRKPELNLTLSVVEGAAVDGEWLLGTQATFQTTLNPSESVTFWRAYDPDHREPTVYLDSDRHGVFTYWLRAPITPDDVSPVDADNNLYYDIALALTKDTTAGSQEYWLYNDETLLPATVPDHVGLDVQSFTVGFDFVLNASTALQIIMGKVLVSYGPSNYEWTVIKNTSGNIVFTVVYATSSTGAITTTEATTDGERYRAVFYFDRSGDELGYDLYHVESSTRYSNSASWGHGDRKTSQVADLHFLATEDGGGAHYEADGYGKGFFYEPSVLSAAERLEYLEDGVPPKALHYWPCDEQTGDTCVDKGSGAANMDASELTWGEVTG